ncbi:hypothetical protein F4777DRAFT_560506 [Nemania sp. FL0916]|nr:hypothetical protein F4777DRAFT_560506 [Nemania sp. FL0916]
MASQKKLRLRVIYDPVEKQKGTPDVDLVLIHGFGGDLNDTWTYKENNSNVFWPCDLLSQKRPRTRILSFGYGVGENVVGTIRDYARTLMEYLHCQRDDAGCRPIVFLGHCLGGLIAKQAVRFAAKESRYKSIAEATKAMMFFGTPHDGGDRKGWLKLAEKYKAMGSRCRMIDVLAKNTDDLLEIDEDFCQLRVRYRTVAFYEIRPLPEAKEVIVCKTSATGPMIADGFEALTVDADHIHMCQFENADDGTFKKVLQVIKDATGEEQVIEGGLVRGTYTREMHFKETFVLEAGARTGGDTEPAAGRVMTIEPQYLEARLAAAPPNPQRKALEPPRHWSAWRPWNTSSSSSIKKYERA